MKKPKPKFTWERLDEIAAEQGYATSGAEWDGITAADYSKHSGRSNSTARLFLEALVAAGKAEGRVVVRGSPARRVKVYRLK